MFRFKRDQSVVNVGGVKIGGQPGELPSVLCGTIFYHGHRIVEDEGRGIFDKKAAKSLIDRQAELSAETGCPSILHLYARSIEAFQNYLAFIDEIWNGPWATQLRKEYLAQDFSHLKPCATCKINTD